MSRRKKPKRMLFGLLAAVILILALVAYRLLSHPSLQPYQSYIVQPSGEQDVGIRLMFMGVSTVLIDDRQTAILSDGFFSRPGVFNLLRIAPNKDRINYALAKGEVKNLAAVLVAHSHHDHAMDSPEVALRLGALLIGSESTRNIAGERFPEQRYRSVKGEETFTFGRFKVKVIKSLHSRGSLFEGEITAPLQQPARVWDYREGGDYSYLIDHEEGLRILIHGSANYIPGFLKDVRADVIFLSIAKLGNDKEFTRDYWREVVLNTGAKIVIPIHWDDFTKPLDQPLEPMPRLMDNFDHAMATILKLANESGVKVRLLPAFQAVSYSDLSK